MAVADVAVAMGPRNRRRLTTTGIVAGAFAAIAAAILLFRSSGGGPATVTAHSSRSSELARITQLWPNLPELPFGSTSKAQVERLAGLPAKIQGSCLVYTPKAGMVGAFPMGQPGSIGFRTADSYKFCFVADALQDVEEHIPGAQRGWIQSSPLYLDR